MFREELPPLTESGFPSGGAPASGVAEVRTSVGTRVHHDPKLAGPASNGVGASDGVVPWLDDRRSASTGGLHPFAMEEHGAREDRAAHVDHARGRHTHPFKSRVKRDTKARAMWQTVIRARGDASWRCALQPT